MSSTLQAKKQEVYSITGPICAPVTPFKEDGYVINGKLCDTVGQLIYLFAVN